MSRFLPAIAMSALLLTSQAHAEVQSLVVELNFSWVSGDNPIEPEEMNILCDQVRQPLAAEIQREIGATNLISRCIHGYLALQFESDGDGGLFAWSIVERAETFRRTTSQNQTREVAHFKFDGTSLVPETVTYMVTRPVEEIRGVRFDDLSQCQANHKASMGGRTVPAGKLAASACFVRDGKFRVVWVGLASSPEDYVKLMQGWDFEANELAR